MKKIMPKVPKIAIPKISVPKIKMPKRKLPAKLLILVILVALAAVAFGYVKGFIFKEEAPQKTEESAREDQSKEPDEADMAGLEDRLATDILKTLKSDRYMIKYRTTTEYNGESFEVETTYSVNGKSIAMTSGDRATIVKDNRVYMLDHTNKRILSWDVTKSNDLERIDTDGLRYQGTSEAGGFICEEYTTSAAGIKLYFEGEKLIKMATTMNQKAVVMDIVEVGKKAPDTLFEVPSDYMTIEID